MTTQPIRNPLADHLITPQNSALVLIDYQPSQFATVRSMDETLLRKNIEKFVAPFSTTPPGEPGEPLVRELRDHPGFFEIRFGGDARAIYTFGQEVRRGQPHVIWCRVGSGDALDKPPAICDPGD